MIEGICYCGVVCWQFDGDLEWVIVCNCMVCWCYGVFWVYGCEDEDVCVLGFIYVYVCGVRIVFFFCLVCGCMVFWCVLICDVLG